MIEGAFKAAVGVSDDGVGGFVFVGRVVSKADVVFVGVGSFVSSPGSGHIEDGCSSVFG